MKVASLPREELRVGAEKNKNAMSYIRRTIWPCLARKNRKLGVCIINLHVTQRTDFLGLWFGVETFLAG